MKALIIFGPSGVGKDTIIKSLQPIQTDPQYTTTQ